MPLEFRLLGAIEASEDGTAFPLGGPRQRAVLADLALHAGHVVSTGQLVEDLWGGGPPATAKRTKDMAQPVHVALHGPFGRGGRAAAPQVLD